MKKESNMIIGRQPVLEALKDQKQLERIYVQSNTLGDIIPEIRKLAQQLQVPINVVPIEKLNALSRSNHQGIIGICGLVQYTDLQQTIDQLVSAGEVPLFLILDGITDVRNIGAMCRTALCCGAQAIIIPDKGVGALNEEAMKSSAGALQKMYICRVNSLLKAIDTLHLNGIAVLTSEMKAEKQVQETDFSGPCAIVMGAEDKGIQAYIVKAADERFSIPMAATFDSLNVSVSAGIILFEALKQRLKK
jgi:23S rRNA (guanosine2251-2'-O)-methyltransferase